MMKPTKQLKIQILFCARKIKIYILFVVCLTIIAYLQNDTFFRTKYVRDYLFNPGQLYLWIPFVKYVWDTWRCILCLLKWQKFWNDNLSLSLNVVLSLPFWSVVFLNTLQNNCNQLHLIFCQTQARKKETLSASKHLFYFFFCCYLWWLCNIPNTTDSVSSHFQMPRDNLKAQCTVKCCWWIFRVFGIARKHCLDCLKSPQSTLKLTRKWRSKIIDKNLC